MLKDMYLYLLMIAYLSIIKENKPLIDFKREKERREKKKPKKRKEMDGTDGDDFPGFQIMVLEEDKVKVRPQLSWLQGRAPVPLQVKPAAAMEMERDIAAALKSCGYINADPSPFSSTTSSYQNKDPIPLLSPLVLPSRFS